MSRENSHTFWPCRYSGALWRWRSACRFMVVEDCCKALWARRQVLETNAAVCLMAVWQANLEECPHWSTSKRTKGGTYYKPTEQVVGHESPSWATRLNFPLYSSHPTSSWKDSSFVCHLLVLSREGIRFHILGAGSLSHCELTTVKKQRSACLMGFQAFGRANSKFLWVFHTKNGAVAPSSQCHHSTKANLLASNSLSSIL